MLSAYYTISHFDENEKLKYKITRKSKSFVKQFLEIMYSASANETFSVTDVFGNSVSSPYRRYYPFTMAAHGGDSVAHNGYIDFGTGHSPYITYYSDVDYRPDSDQCGIVIGTGTATVTPSDYWLDSAIGHGTSIGEIEYFGCWTNNLTIDSGSGEGYFDVERMFYNSSGSGGDLDVAEIGLCGVYNNISDYVYRSYLLIRDNVSPAVTVADGEYLKVKYTIKISA